MNQGILQDIGLKSLTSIVRGSVRIEKNPLLCFYDTIDWLYIANGTQGNDHFILGNKNANECPVCHTGKINDVDIECPASREDNRKRNCWNQHFCQKGKRNSSPIIYSERNGYLHAYFTETLFILDK